MTSGTGTKPILVGAVVGAHGVRGEVKIKSFTALAKDVGAYGPVSDESGKRRFAVRVRGEARGLVVARLEGIEDRNAAEALKGMRLYVERAALGARPKRAPKGAEIWYHADLVGLAVEDTQGRRIGTVKALANYGAGDIVEVAGEGGQNLLLPFTKRVVPVVDVDGGRIVVDPPVEVEAKEGGPDE
ncbi:MAG: 16S rRNA processing protein RimM [Alphaproteobacteria bacterium]|nr:16S rRNA processing protein RimM [Alphaproteobacteria bacterium]